MGDGPELKVRFTQEITVHPPPDIEDEYDAKCWMENDPEWILRDAISVSHGDVEILEINE